jgi:Arc/MetJ family transcription regulator
MPPDESGRWKERTMITIDDKTVQEWAHAKNLKLSDLREFVEMTVVRPHTEKMLGELDAALSGVPAEESNAELAKYRKELSDFWAGQIEELIKWAREQVNQRMLH